MSTTQRECFAKRMSCGGRGDSSSWGRGGEYSPGISTDRAASSTRDAHGCKEFCTGGRPGCRRWAGRRGGSLRPKRFAIVPGRGDLGVPRLSSRPDVACASVGSGQMVIRVGERFAGIVPRTASRSIHPRCLLGPGRCVRPLFRVHALIRTTKLRRQAFDGPPSPSPPTARNVDVPRSTGGQDHTTSRSCIQEPKEPTPWMFSKP